VGAEPTVSSLYVHVPFCVRKCGYCAFYSEPARPGLVDRYVAALRREMELVAADLKPRTVYFGGGTPTLLNLRQWEDILQAMERLGWGVAQEWTVECNPATVSSDQARLLRAAGVNRMSIGVQSLDDGLLARLGRVHSREMVFQTFDLLRAAGFDNLNVDLMFGIPGQSLATWQATLAEALALGSEHLSCYEVIYEEDTPLFEQLQAGRFEVDEDLACDMYEELLRAAARHGYCQYEIANFAKHRGSGGSEPGIPDLACRHNVNYWRGGSFYGLGPGATSCVGGVRARNLADTLKYCEQLETGRRAIEFTEQLSPLGRAGEVAAFGLRMNAGWPFAEFERATGFDLRQQWAAEMELLQRHGLACIEPDRFQLTARGLRFADLAAEHFLRDA
jgi:oxygen-independent coproporphyrinogen-3 oxidase